MPETTPAWLVERLKNEGEKTAAYFASLRDEQWDTRVYSEGEPWTVRSVLAHFVTSERGLLKLFESIYKGGPGASEDFSVDGYNARQQEKTRDLTPEELLRQFVEAREATVKWVSRLSEADLQKAGRHPSLGQVSLLEMIKTLYVHNQIHFRDFRKLVK